MKELLYGAAYYDEYMPYERLAKDVSMMQKAGINTVRIAESTWSTCEPQEGVFDFSHVIRVMDAMEKAGSVEIIGYENVASGYISILVKGDVSAVESAVQAGVKAVEAMGAEVYSSLVIPSPHPDLEKVTEIYNLDNLI